MFLEIYINYIDCYAIQYSFIKFEKKSNYKYLCF